MKNKFGKQPSQLLTAWSKRQKRGTMGIEEKIARINELYHKSQAEGLSAEEKEEQDRLRREYVANVRANLRGQLNNIDMIMEDGSVENLGDMVKKKNGEERKH